MSRMTPVAGKKRRLEEAMRGKTSKPKRHIKKQKNYHSSEDEEEVDSAFTPVNLGDSDDDQPNPPRFPSKQKSGKPKPLKTRTVDAKAAQGASTKREADHDEPLSSSDEGGPTGSNAVQIVEPVASDASERDSDDDSGSDSNSDSTAVRKRPKSKRNDPDAFSTSMAKILGTKLPTSQRSDPVLSRSVEAQKSRNATTSEKLEAKAKAKMRAEKQAALQKGRTTDVLGIERGITGEVAEKEKGLRKIATRGVIQLFNAFRAAHERAEEARREERKRGTVGMGERERKVNEVSKEGFLELIGGKKKAAEAT